MTVPLRELRMMGVDPLALRLREWRRKHKLRQHEVSRMLGMYPSSVCSLELGLRYLRDPKLRARLEQLISGEPLIAWRQQK